jgi:hypothetical protein
MYSLVETISSYNNIPNIIDNIDLYLKKYKKFYTFTTFAKTFINDDKSFNKNIVIQLDASNSLLQIYSTILKNTKLMSMCNLNNNEDDKIQDLYTNILTKFKKNE